MTKVGRSGNLLFASLTVIVIIAGSLLWMSDLNKDAPAFFNNVGQSLATDPGHCVYHARNKILFDNSDPFDQDRWLIFRGSLVSVVAYLWFSIAGVSLEQAATVGVVLSLGALLLFLLATSYRHRPWVAAAIAICYLTNMCLAVHGRLPYLENGLIFFISAAFLVYSRWGDKVWGLCVTATLVAAATIMGKLTGALLLPALLLTEWSYSRQFPVRRVVWSLVTFTLVSLALLLGLYGKNLTAILGFFGERSYALYGFPSSLKSPWAFVESVIRYGEQNSLFYYSPDLLVFLWLGGFLLTCFAVSGYRFSGMSRVTALAMFAIPFVLLGLSVVNYSPLRFGILLIPLAVLVFFTLADHLRNDTKAGSQKNGYFWFLPLLVLTWQGLYHVVGFVRLDSLSGRTLVWVLLPIALALTGALRYLVITGRLVLGRIVLYSLITVALVFTVSVHGYRGMTYLWNNNETSIKMANTDLSAILGNDAVIAGPYAPILTLETKLKSLIYYFEVLPTEPDLLQRLPITHLAVDSVNWTEVVKFYPALQNEVPITNYMIRDYEVRIYNISNISGNQPADRYRATAYERAAIHRSRQEYQEAFNEISVFIDKYPDCWSANVLLAELLMRARQFSDATEVLTALADRHPQDYYTNLICGWSFQVMGLQARDNNLLTLSQLYYDRAAQNYPHRAENVRLVYEATMRQFNDDSN